MAYLHPDDGAWREGGIIPAGAQAANVAPVASSVPAGGTGTAAGGWDTAANRNLAIVSITETQQQLNALIASLVAAGVVAAS